MKALFRILYIILLGILMFFTVSKLSIFRKNIETQEIIEESEIETEVETKADNEVEAEETEIETEAETEVETQIEDESWALLFVNKFNPYPAGANEVELVELTNGRFVDVRIYPYLQEMFDDMREAGLLPYVTWGYREKETQENLFYNSYYNLINQGYGESDAWELTATAIAVPGTSEHEIGLAVDIVDERGGEFTQQVYDWLASNAHNYGFHLRYPENKTHITYIMFEPWHYRYVGKKVALELFESGLTLEEYLGKVE